MPTLFRALVLAVLAITSVLGQDGVLSWPEFNLSLRLPAGWVQVEAGDNLVSAFKEGNALQVHAALNDATPEEAMNNIVAYVRNAAVMIGDPTRTKVTVAGEPGQMCEARYRENEVERRGFFVVFAHQGVLYTVTGVHNKGDRGTMSREVRTLLSRIRFLGDRPEWMARMVGRPSTIVMGGGLARFTLNQPRWREATFTASSRNAERIRAEFHFVGGGGFLYVDIAATQRDLAAETEAMRHEWLGLLPDGAITDGVATIAGVEQPMLTITGMHENIKRVVRLVAVVVDGAVLRVALEAHATRVEDLTPDWESILGSLAMVAAAAVPEPLAYPLAPQVVDLRQDPAVAALIASGRPLWRDDEATVIGVSPDATHVLCVGEETYLEDLASHRRTPVAIPLQRWNAPRVAWSADGARFAIATADAIQVVTVEPLAVRGLPVVASDVAFHGDRLIACLPIASGETSGRVVVTATLAEVDAATGATRTLCTVPLGRFALPAVDPAGGRVAVACNRDQARSDGNALNVMLAAAAAETAAAELRPLTTGIESILALGWSAEGLFAVRMLAGDGGRAPGTWSGEGDLWRLDPEGGPAQRLSACRRIRRAWPVKEGVAVAIDSWSVGRSQRGVFLLPWSVLVDRSESVEPVSGGRDRVAAAVLAASGAAAVAAVVPTATSLAAMADAFAGAMGAEYGERLDFTAESLDRISASMQHLEFTGIGAPPALLLGLGAYYGETLRRAVGATWHVAPQPFGEWMASADGESKGNAMVRVTLPFTDIAALALGSESLSTWGPSVVRDLAGQRLVLCYPSREAVAAVEAASDPGYLAAWAAVDRGDSDAALAGLTEVVGRHGANPVLLAETVALAMAAGRAADGERLRAAAVDAGTADAALIQAEALACADRAPERALTLWRSLASRSWVAGATYVALGKAYARLDRRELALDCLRRAHVRGADEDLTVLAAGLQPDAEPTAPAGSATPVRDESDDQVP